MRKLLLASAMLLAATPLAAQKMVKDPGGGVGITPFSAVRECRPAEPGCAPIVVPAGTYTRLKLEWRPAANPNDKALEYRKRHMLIRMAMGRRFLSTMLLKASSGPFTATVPLLSVEHDSSTRRGETFVRSYVQDQMDFPLFLMRPGASGIARMEAVMSASAAVTPLAASLVVNAARRVADATDPTPGVLTTLSEGKARALAVAMENTVAQLMASAITETHGFDLSITEHMPRMIEMWMPSDQGGWELDRSEDGAKKRDAGLVGTWRVSFAKPRPTLFSMEPCTGTADCATGGASGAAAIDAIRRPNEILAYSLLNTGGELGTILSYLRQRDWWSEQTGAIASAGTQLTADPVGRLCRSVRNTLTQIGLNDLDARLVSHALARTGAVAAPAAPLMLTDPACKVTGVTTI